MNTKRNSQRVSSEDRLRFTLNLNEQETQAAAEWRHNLSQTVNLAEITNRSTVDQATVVRALADPTVLEHIRLNPNRVGRDQLAKIPGVAADRLDQVINGRPYYSLKELAVAAAVPQTILTELFDIPLFCLRDKPADREVMLEPVPERYIIPPKKEFEEEDLARQRGYVDLFSATDNFNFRVVEPADFEQEQEVHKLKAALEGQVHPVLCDAEGFERYLVPGFFDLWFRVETPEARRRAIIQTLGGRVVNALPNVGYYRVELTEIPKDLNVTRKVFEVVEEAQKLDEVTLAEPEQVGFNDFGLDYSITVTEGEDFETADRFWNYDAIELDTAHRISEGSRKVTIFIIDSGVWVDHQDLASALRPDWRRLDLNFNLGVPEAELSPDERTISHGTKVSGIVGGRGEASTRRVEGVAPECHILPVKIPGQQGGPAAPGYGLRAAAIRQVLKYLKPDERAVLNISWRTNGEHFGIREALVEAQSKGVAIVASAGNYGPGESQRPDDVHYPSAYTYREPHLTALCSVGAVDSRDHKANYSYYGAQSVTIMAPGGEVGGPGTGIYTTSTPERYTYTTGTSFAVPHVVGLIGLLFSLKPDLSPAEAIAIIRDTADPIDDINPTYAGMLGAGRINVRAALERVKTDNGALKKMTSMMIKLGKRMKNSRAITAIQAKLGAMHLVRIMMSRDG